MKGRAIRMRAPPGFEPGMADLQSAALAAWLRCLVDITIDLMDLRAMIVALAVNLGSKLNRYKYVG